MRSRVNFFPPSKEWIEKDLEFSPDLMFTKFAADRLCQNITYIYTKDPGLRVSLPLIMFLLHTSLLSIKNPDGRIGILVFGIHD